MESFHPIETVESKVDALPAVSELLILPDGRVMAHNLTPNFLALLSELNPDAPQFRPRREAAAPQSSAISHQLSANILRTLDARKPSESAECPSPALAGTLSPSDGERAGVRGFPLIPHAPSSPGYSSGTLSL